MLSRQLPRKQAGQVLVLVALVMLILIAFVGLSADVGTAYSHQRKDQSGATAGALAIMDSYLRGTSSTPTTSAALIQALQLAMTRNSIDSGTYTLMAPGSYAASGSTIWAEFLDGNGNSLSSLVNSSSSINPNTKFVHVTITELVKTNFAQIVGRNTLTVSADAYATICRPLQGVYPLTFDMHVLDGITPNENGGPAAEVWVSSHSSRGNFGSLYWNSGNNSTSNLSDAWTGGGTLLNPVPFEEGSHQETEVNPLTGRNYSSANPPDGTYLNSYIDLYNDPANPSAKGGGDWMWGDTGVSNASGVGSALDWHINHDNPGTFVQSENDWSEMIFPLFSLNNADYDKPVCANNTNPCTQLAKTYGVWGDDDGQGGNNYQYKIVIYGRFRLKDYSLSQGTGHETSCQGTSWTGGGFCLQFLGYMRDGRSCPTGGSGIISGPQPTPAPTTTPQPLVCRNNPLGLATGYSNFILGDVNKSNTDTEGKMAVKGNASLSSYGVNSSRQSGDALIVGGNLNYSNGTVGAGNVVYAGSLITSSVTLNSGSWIRGSRIDFNAATTYLQEKSLLWKNQAANAPTNLSFGTLSLRGTNTTLNIFAVTELDFRSATSISINVPNGSSVLINVQGTNITVPNIGTSLTGVTNAKVLYNFYEATRLSSNSLEGSILAPLADYSFSNGHVNGSIIAASFSGNGETGSVTFGGCLPLP